MFKNIFNLKNFYKLFFINIIIFFIIFPIFLHQKMPLNSSMTFSSPLYNVDELKIYNISKTSFIEINGNTYSNSKKNYENYKTLPVSLYFIIIGCSTPIIVLMIILLIPSKKITNNIIAYDLDKHKKKKINLGMQQTKQRHYKDDENL